MVDLTDPVYGIIAIIEGVSDNGEPVPESPHIYVVLPEEEAAAAEMMILRLGQFPNQIKVAIRRGTELGPDQYDDVVCEAGYTVEGKLVSCFPPVHFPAEQRLIDQFLESQGITGSFMMGLGYYENEGGKEVIHISDSLMVGEQVEFVQAVLAN